MEKQKAKNWYWWLWLSPLVTIPTVIVLYFSDVDRFVRDLLCPQRSCDYTLRYIYPMAALLLLSGLWHLILLIPALDKKSEFVRWHGKQALLLAGVRTAVPVGLILFTDDAEGVILAIPILIVIWLFGTLWGQRQAARGDCWLMRRFGREEALPLLEPGVDEPVQANKLERENALVEAIRFDVDPILRARALRRLQIIGKATPAFGSAAAQSKESESTPEVEELVENIRLSPDREERRKSLNKLQGRGLVEPL